MNTTKTPPPTWATEHKLDYKFAPNTLKNFIRKYCHISPRFYAVRDLRNGEKEYCAWNSRSTETLGSETVDAARGM